MQSQTSTNQPFEQIQKEVKAQRITSDGLITFFEQIQEQMEKKNVDKKIQDQIWELTKGVLMTLDNIIFNQDQQDLLSIPISYMPKSLQNSIYKQKRIMNQNIPINKNEYFYIKVYEFIYKSQKLTYWRKFGLNFGIEFLKVLLKLKKSNFKTSINLFEHQFLALSSQNNDTKIDKSYFNDFCAQLISQYMKHIRKDKE